MRNSFAPDERLSRIYGVSEDLAALTGADKWLLLLRRHRLLPLHQTREPLEENKVFNLEENAQADAQCRKPAATREL